MTRLWFKAKTYGYGWTPATWEGWVVIATYLVLHLTAVWGLSYWLQFGPHRLIIGAFITFIVLNTGALVYVSYKKGEPARWRWGKDPKKPNE